MDSQSFGDVMPLGVGAGLPPWRPIVVTGVFFNPPKAAVKLFLSY